MIKLLQLSIVIAVSTAFPAIDPAYDCRILGGNDAPAGRFPHMISLRGSSGHHNCGGVIISENYVLTAAHCVKNGNPKELFIVAGSNRLNCGGTKYGISKIIVHEHHSVVLIANDIALLKTTTPIDLSKPNVAVAALPQEGPKPDSEVYISGWGFPVCQENATHPNNLKFLKLHTISYEDCKAKMPTLIPFVLKSQVCAFNDYGRGICRGDSGSPLVTPNNTLVGLVSWGIPCGLGYPDVFTSVYSFLDWINTNAELK